MKFIRTILIGLAILAAVPVWAQGRRGFGDGQPGAFGPSSRTGVVSAPLSDAEASFLYHLREEEKLARDVYDALNAKWGFVVFSNIAESEERHFEAMGNLIIRYGLKDPAANTQPGLFVNADLQALYDKLIIQGSASLIDALKAGITIEVTDINDLGAAIKATDNTDALSVYANLLKGSKRHLSAFESHLEILGIK
jgi:hypothetical protein